MPVTGSHTSVVQTFPSSGLTVVCEHVPSVHLSVVHLSSSLLSPTVVHSGSVLGSSYQKLTCSGTPQPGKRQASTTAHESASAFPRATTFLDDRIANPHQSGKRDLTLSLLPSADQT